MLSPELLRSQYYQGEPFPTEEMPNAKGHEMGLSLLCLRYKKTRVAGLW